LERQPGHLAVIFLDLDRFKVVNDSLGHAAGDSMLIEVATRLSEVARRSDTVARFGGDEFVILCERLSVDEDAGVIAARISRAFEQPFMYEGQPMHVTGSMGIAVTDGSATSAEELIRDADAAMYQAKERGHGNGSFQFFDPGIRARAVARMTVEGELRRALENDEFRLHYQPLVKLDATHSIVGVEALIRWQHPQRGLLAPAEFMAVAEDSNLIVVIGRWVLDEACRQIAEWNAERPDAAPLGVAVNVSARQLAHQSLSDDVAAALERHSVKPQWLTIEMTETALLEEAVASGSTLNDLSRLGVHIALDDFGTGYSSLSHLRRFPVDIIKIDRGFVSGLDSLSDDAPIVAAVTAMAHALGLTTIGEGIETAGQLQALQDLGCDEGQGFLLSHPLPAADVWALLQRS
jgi:diguanylate cyclase (GGDEF)-like protein